MRRNTSGYKTRYKIFFSGDGKNSTPANKNVCFVEFEKNAMGARLVPDFFFKLTFTAGVFWLFFWQLYR